MFRVKADALPESWAVARLSQICVINPKVDFGHLKDSDKVSFVPMPLVEELSGKFTPTQLETVGTVKKGYTRFIENDVLFAKITPCMENGKTAIAKGLYQGLGAGSTEFHVLRGCEGISNKYVLYYLLQAAFRHDAQHHMTGAVGQKRVPTKYIEDSEIPVPPSKEQKRIVDKIEQLFSDLDQGETLLKTVQKQLGTYRQAVLKAAVAGQLIGASSSEWKHYTVGDLLTDIRYGTSKKCTVDPSKTPVLRIPNVADGRIDISDLKHADFTEKEFAKLRLEQGDLLLVRSNGSVSLVGLSAIVKDIGVGYAYAGYLIRLRLKRDLVLPDFLNLYLHSPMARSMIERQARSTSGVHNINSDEVKAISLMVPDIPLQEKLLDRVNDLFSQMDALEIWCMTELKRSGALRQSILKDAFSGKLVSQDPGDEPASVLIERIMAERAIKQMPKAKGNGRSRKSEAA